MATRHVNFVVESATAKLTISDDGTRATLTNVFARRPGRGHGSLLMEEICKYADQEMLIVILEPRQYHYRNGEGLDNYQLLKFYIKFDFDVIPRPGARSVWMRRYPSVF